MIAGLCECFMLSSFNVFFHICNNYSVINVDKVIKSRVIFECNLNP